MFQYYHLTNLELRAAERRRHPRLEPERSLAIAATPRPSFLAVLQTVARHIALPMTRRAVSARTPSTPTGA